MAGLDLERIEEMAPEGGSGGVALDHADMPEAGVIGKDPEANGGGEAPPAIGLEDEELGHEVAGRRARYRALFDHQREAGNFVVGED
jgi:hypothetical protein